MKNTTISYQVGEARITIVPEFAGNPMPLAMAMPAVTDEDLRLARPWLQDDMMTETVSQSVLELSWHIYVIQIGKHNILIDSGLGNDKERPEHISFANKRNTDLLAHFQALAIAPEDIDLVICTHLHFDHVGWNTVSDGERWVPTFPNARYVFTEIDYEHFRKHADSDPVTGPAFRDSVQPIIDANQHHFVSDGEVLIAEPGATLSAVYAAGHSPGSMVLRLISHETEALFTGDVIHHPIQLVRPDICLAFEETPVLGMATRQRVLSDAAQREILLLPAHFTGYPAGYVRAAAQGFRWEPVRPIVRAEERENA